MTVTELREALQKLEAEGHGALNCLVRVDFKDRYWLDDVEPEIWTVPAGYDEAGSTVVKLA